jgi:hypothetical protein
MPLPATVTYDETNLPQWVYVIPEGPGGFTIEITLETYDRIKFRLVNIEGLLIDLNKAILDTGLTVADVQAIIAFLRFTAPRITLIVDGTGVDTYEIILPPGLTVSQVINATTGQPVPFIMNAARNSVVFTVEFASTLEIQMVVASVTNVLNRAVASISTVMILSGVLQVVLRELNTIMEEVRSRV